jgi:hypothetical protein
MKALTLTAPYGTLIAVGVKGPETRGAPPAGEMCPPGVRALPGCGLARGERLLIHQAQSHPPVDVKVGEWTMFRFNRMGPLTLGRSGDRHPDEEVLHGVALGSIVASCVIEDAVPMVSSLGTTTWREMESSGVRRWVSVGPTRQDRADGRDAVRLRLVWLDDDGWLHSEEITDQIPYGTWERGRWAWLLGDVKPTTERCPACWGQPGDALYTGSGQPGYGPCPTCNGAGVCGPVPAKGRQGVWEWTP